MNDHLEGQNISVIVHVSNRDKVFPISTREALADCIDLVEYVLAHKLTSEVPNSTSLQVVITIIRQPNKIDLVKITANGEVLYEGNQVNTVYFDGCGNVMCPHCQEYFVSGINVE